MKTPHLLGVCIAAITAPLSFTDAALIGNDFTLSSIYDIDTVTGAATNARSTGLSSSLSGIVYDSFSGNLFGLTAYNGSTPNSLVNINPITGAATLVGATGLTMIVEGDLAVNPLNGRLYGVQNSPFGIGRSLFEINPATGAATTIASLASSGDFSALAFNATGTLFTINTTGAANSILSTVNPVTGALLTSVTLNIDLGATAGLTFDFSTGTAYLAHGDTAAPTMLYTLNVNTGTVTPVGPVGNSQGMAGLAFLPGPGGPAPVVPEPSAVLSGLMVMGICGRALLSRNRPF